MFDSCCFTSTTRDSIPFVIIMGTQCEKGHLRSAPTRN
jgi:hypothetical protein